MKEYRFYVYIMFNQRNGALYTGVTNNIVKRVYEHKRKINHDSFTARYNCDKLGYFEEYSYIDSAIVREKQIKGRPRKYKIFLIESVNPDWLDLSVQDMFWIRQ